MMRIEKDVKPSLNSVAFNPPDEEKASADNYEESSKYMHPIVSAAQRAARRISMKARRNLGKKVRIMDEPQIIPISPRPGKTPGIIKMPNFLNDKSDISTNNSKIRSKAGIHKEALSCHLMDLRSRKRTGPSPSSFTSIPKRSKNRKKIEEAEKENEKNDEHEFLKQKRRSSLFIPVPSTGSCAKVKVWLLMQCEQKFSDGSLLNDQESPQTNQIAHLNAGDSDLKQLAEELDDAQSKSVNVLSKEKIAPLFENKKKKVGMNHPKSKVSTPKRFGQFQNASISNTVNNIEICEVKLETESRKSSALKRPKNASGNDQIAVNHSGSIFKKSLSDFHFNSLKEFDHAPFSNFGHVDFSSLCISYNSFKLAVRNESSPHVEDKCRTSNPVDCNINEKCININISSCDMWCEALRPRRLSEILANENSIKKIHVWLKNWKKRLEIDILPPAPRKKLRKRKGEDTDEDYEDDANFDLSNTFILSGPVGCGKTAAIYGIAEELGIGIIESNSSEKRSAANLKTKLQGATQSFGKIDFQILSTGNLRSVFQKKTPFESLTQFSLILIDDADIILPEDENFWSNLKNICLNSKVPIVITCTDSFHLKQELSKTPKIIYETADLSYPNSDQLANYFCVSFLTFHYKSISIKVVLVLSALGFEESDVFMKNTLTSIVKHFRCDIRAVTNHLQFYFQYNDRSKYLKPTNSNIGFIQSLAQPCFSGRLHLDLNHIDLSDIALIDRPPHSSLRQKNERFLRFHNIRHSLPMIKYFPFSDIATDYIPYLALLDRTYRSKRRNSRRSIHYFDEVRGEVAIDQYGLLENIFSDYDFPDLFAQ
ncbi:unnamed protein product [Dracunculus medinensis]|uniref:ATPase_AAA_core domain-containing protein n=1 Tax=Dracunculus medinensis TaxID=318479 RepID=A0A158Q4F0_DRAME|nr:unnamed protein product [Dracunculus medinensis]